jgi:hypothetical protein
MIMSFLVVELKLKPYYNYESLLTKLGSSLDSGRI